MRESSRGLLAKAQAAGGPAVVFTFDPHPVRIPAASPCSAAADLDRSQGGAAGRAGRRRRDRLSDRRGAAATYRAGVLPADRARHARRAGHGRRTQFLFRPRPARHDRRAAAIDRRGGHRSGSRRAAGGRRRDRLQLARAAADRRRSRGGSRLAVDPAVSHSRHGGPRRGTRGEAGLWHCQSERHRHAFARRGRLRRARIGEQYGLAGRDQHWTEPDVRQRRAESRSPFAGLGRRAAVRTAA